MRNRRFIDIALNLTDCVFFGVDRKGRTVHDSDIEHVVQRAVNAGVGRMIITGTSLDVSRRAIEVCRRFPGKCFCTVGIHPAHSDEFLADSVRATFAARVTAAAAKIKKSQIAPAGTRKAAVATATTSASDEPIINQPSAEDFLDAAFSATVMARLHEMAAANRDVVVAIGECGLDYAELSPVVTPKLQAHGLHLQVQLARQLGLPLLLHSRDCGMDFAKLVLSLAPREPQNAEETMQRELISSSHPGFIRGVVHSFNGSGEELAALVRDGGLSIGVNASAFREESVARAIAKIPLEKLMIETDAPWCDPRPGDWGFDAADAVIGKTMPPFVAKEHFVAGQTCLQRRNEPATLPAVFAMLCKAFGVEYEGDAADAMAHQIHTNVMRMFFPENRQRDTG